MEAPPNGLWIGVAWYGLAWISFAGVHSLLARPRVIAKLRPWFGSAYRLAYNGFALFHFALIWAVGVWALGGQTGFFSEPIVTPIAIVGWICVALGVAVLWYALKFYDTGRFLGTAQWQAGRAGQPITEDEGLRLDGPHRYVRHPLYTGAFLVLWGRALDPLGLATAVFGSLYLIIGSRFEEQKLMGLYGPAYGAYRRAVPAFIPRLTPYRAPGSETDPTDPHMG